VGYSIKMGVEKDYANIVLLGSTKCGAKK
jgi:hypothetical protein